MKPFYFFLIVFADPAKRDPQTAVVRASAREWAMESFMRSNPDCRVLRVDNGLLDIWTAREQVTA